ncbi:MAG: sulfatase [Gemmatimonadota bacterium]|nr:sulfatase [Gemmatimonadota bacterium]
MAWVPALKPEGSSAIGGKTAARGTSNILALAACGALVTAIAELALQAGLKVVLGKYTHLGLHVVWMTPVANLFVFGAIGLLFAAVNRLRRSPALFPAAAGVFAVLFVLSILFNARGIHWAAVAALAVGAAVQASRLATLHPVAIMTLVRRITVPLAVLLLALTAATLGRRWLLDGRSVAALESPQPGAPNILLLILDTVRARSLGLYGRGQPTSPRLERLTSQGVVFDLALSPSPWTLPSHATMFTGRWPHENRADWGTPLSSSASTLAEMLSGAGYATAGFAANVAYCSRESGLAQGFVHYEDFVISPGRILDSSSLVRGALRNRQFRKTIGFFELPGRKRAPGMHRRLLRWLGGHEDRPWFAFVNYYDAHAPYLPQAPFDELLGPRRSGEPALIEEVKIGSMTPLSVPAEREAYEESVAYLDHHVGVLLDSLEQRGALRNTVVIVTSDHGEEFSEHGQMGHGSTLFLEVLHVPLIFAGTNRISSGLRVSQPVSLRDLAATVMELTGSSQPGLSGHSLAGILAGDTSAKVSRAFSSLGEMRSLLDDEFHYLTDPTGSEHLYAFRRDPQEQRNLAQSPEFRSHVARLRISADSIVSETERKTEQSIR